MVSIPGDLLAVGVWLSEPDRSPTIDSVLDKHVLSESEEIDVNILPIQ
jgi:hypothetical protein